VSVGSFPVAMRDDMGGRTVACHRSLCCASFAGEGAGDWTKAKKHLTGAAAAQACVTNAR
jgi:hypothetical protein